MYTQQQIYLHRAQNLPSVSRVDKVCIEMHRLNPFSKSFLRFSNHFRVIVGIQIEFLCILIIFTGLLIVIFINNAFVAKKCIIQLLFGILRGRKVFIHQTMHCPFVQHENCLVDKATHVQGIKSGYIHFFVSRFPHFHPRLCSKRFPRKLE